MGLEQRALFIVLPDNDTTFNFINDALRSFSTNFSFGRFYTGIQRRCLFMCG